MKGRSIEFCLLCAAVLMLLTAVSAGADTVIVTPDNMGIWSTAVANGAQCRFQEAALGDPAPYGAFLGQCGVSGSVLGGPDPGEVWIGTDVFSGTPIADITTLKYSAWTLPQGLDSIHFVKQPFQLQIAIRKNGPDDLNWRYLMFRPWGTIDNPEGFNQLNPYATWETYDCTTGVWWDGWANKVFASWAAVQAAYPNGILSTPPQGFTPMFVGSTSTPVTGTGGSLNLEAGARAIIMTIFNITGYAWWQESINFSGYVDNFTIGITPPGGSEQLTTYDFESTPFVNESTVFLNNKSAKDPIISTAKYHHEFVAFGLVQADATFTLDSFLLRSGSDVIKVSAPNHGIIPIGDTYVRVVGKLENRTTPATLMSSAEQIQQIFP